MKKMTCSSDTYEECLSRLVQGIEEFVKPYKELTNKNEAKEIYPKNIQDVIDVYETEMNELFVNNLFLKNTNFYKNHLRNRNLAWGLLNFEHICDGDKFDFNQAITSSYLRFKQINKDNREKSEVGAEADVKVLSIDENDANF